MLVHLLVEGFVDEALGLRLLHLCGHEAGATFGKKGWTFIAEKASVYDKSCVAHGLLTLVDFMDTAEECAPAVVKSWLPHRSSRHIFRVVLREIESWILADREGISTFLGVHISKIPMNPELLPDPKQFLINLARTSRKRSVRRDLVPEQGYSSSEGPLYSSEVSRFVTTHWNAANAREHSESLDRCITRLMQLTD